MATMQVFAPKSLATRQAEDIEGLSLPLLTASRGTQNRDFWKELSYEHFVEQLQRKNPDAVLTKFTADSASRVAVDRLCSVARGRESCIIRVSRN
jgi:hypothetical protein